MSTNGHSAAPKREDIIRESTYLAAVDGCYDTSEAAQRSNLLTISIMDMANIPGEPLPEGATHQMYVMINGTGYLVTRYHDGYTVDPHDQTENQRQERELRDAVLEAALWYLTGEGAGYQIGSGTETRNAVLKELLEKGPEGEEPEEGEESDPVLHPVIREEEPDPTISLVASTDGGADAQVLRQWAVTLGPYNRCTVCFFGYDAEENSPILIPQERDQEDEE